MYQILPPHHPSAITHFLHRACPILPGKKGIGNSICMSLRRHTSLPLFGQARAGGKEEKKTVLPGISYLKCLSKISSCSTLESVFFIASRMASYCWFFFVKTRLLSVDCRVKVDVSRVGHLEPDQIRSGDNRGKDIRREFTQPWLNDIDEEGSDTI